MEIRIKETYNSYTKDYTLEAVDSIGFRHCINPCGNNPFELRTKIPRAERQRETFALQRKLNDYF